MKKKILLASVAFVAAVSSTVIGIAHSDSLTTSALEVANIEALSSGENNFDLCKNGCSTNNDGSYCCTLFDRKLYYPRTY